MALLASLAMAHPTQREAAAAPLSRRALAWGVHLFTASAAVADLLALLASSLGRFQEAVLWMLYALSVDSVDGMLARRVGVSRLLPEFDGRRLDDIVDYLTYVAVPAVFLVQAQLLPHWGFGALMMLASAYGFSQAQAKTSDQFFLGFPSYWNVVAFYCWLLELPPAWSAAAVVLLALLVFVPFAYLYPSRMPGLRRTNHALSLVCMLLLTASVLDPARGRAYHWVELSLAYPVFYLVLSARWGGLRLPGAAARSS